mmetsp:Transcript_148034/g.359343  ORF Transcript_148034/g.359343 Transcript_148034/m.359343 type:complete len:274 (+) Transcript_148034:87-908(+)
MLLLHNSLPCSLNAHSKNSLTGSASQAVPPSRPSSQSLNGRIHELRLLPLAQVRELPQTTRHGLLLDVGLHLLSGVCLQVPESGLRGSALLLQCRLHLGAEGDLELLLVLLNARVDLRHHLLGLRLSLLRLREPRLGLLELDNGIINVGLDLLLPACHGLAQQRRKQVDKAGNEHHNVDDARLRDVQVDGEAAAQGNLAEVQQATLLLCHCWRSRAKRCGRSRCCADGVGSTGAGLAGARGQEREARGVEGGQHEGPSHEARHELGGARHEGI